MAATRIWQEPAVFGLDNLTRRRGSEGKSRKARHWLYNDFRSRKRFARNCHSLTKSNYSHKESIQGLDTYYTIALPGRPTAVLPSYSKDQNVGLCTHLSFVLSFVSWYFLCSPRQQYKPWSAMAPTNMDVLVSSTFALQHVFLSFAFVCPLISTCSFPFVIYGLQYRWWQLTKLKIWQRPVNSRKK